MVNDFVLDYIESYNVREKNTGPYNTSFRYLVKIDESFINGGNFPHGFIIKDAKNKTKQKIIEYAPDGLDIAYCTQWDKTNPRYEIFGYVFETFNTNSAVSRKNNSPMYLVYDDKLEKLLNQTRTTIVTNGGGARRKSKNVTKNVKKSRRKSRKSRKQRKSN